MKEHGILFTAPMARALFAGTKTQTRRPLSEQPPAGVEAFQTYHHPKGIAHYGWDEADKSLMSWCAVCPYGVPSDRLWVRETFFAFGRWETRFSAKKKRDEWHFIDMTLECGHEYAYVADGHSCAPHQRTAGTTPCWWKRPAIFMPRMACRLVLEVTQVRVERLQGISPDDAQAEGLKGVTKDGRLVKYGIPDADGWPGTDDHGWPWADWRISPVDAYRRLWDQINGADSAIGWAANPWVWAVSFRVLPSDGVSPLLPKGGA